MLAKYPLKAYFEADIVFVEVRVKFFGAEDFGDLFKLIVVVCTFEEGLSVKNLRLKKELPSQPS